MGLGLAHVHAEVELRGKYGRSKYSHSSGGDGIVDRAAYYLLLTTHYAPRTTHHAPRTTHYSLRTPHSALLTTTASLPTRLRGGSDDRVDHRPGQRVLDLAVGLMEEAAVVALLHHDEDELRPVLLTPDGDTRSADGGDLGVRGYAWVCMGMHGAATLVHGVATSGARGCSLWLHGAAASGNTGLPPLATPRGGNLWTRRCSLYYTA